MNKKLTVSVVVCTRNRNDYLKKCIASLLNQTYLPKEIIVVEDYSTEDLNVFEFFKKEFSDMIFSLKNFNFETRIILLRNEQQSGIVKSRNLGIRIARGDVVAFLDDDSFAHRNWMRNLVKNYEDEKIVGVGGPFIEIGRKNLPDLKKNITRLSYISKKNGRIIFNYRIKKYSDRNFLPRKFVSFLLGGNMSFRREILFKIGGCDSRFTGNAYHEETDMSFRASRLGKLLFDPNAVTYHNTAKKGGNRDVIKFDLNMFLFYMFRNTSLFFLKHFGLRKAVRLVKKLFLYQLKMFKQNKTGLSRDYLQLRDIKKSILSVVSGCIIGFYDWFKTRKDEVELIFSQPENVKAYQIIILSSSIKIIELENRIHILKKLFKL